MTMQGTAAQDYDPQVAQQWAKAVQWKRLMVLSTQAHPNDQDSYYVKFRVFYIIQGRPQQLLELSEFKRIDGRWYYIASIHDDA